MKPLPESTLIVCGLVRNCRRNIERNMRTMICLCQMAKDYRFVIFENDSDDGSKEILQKYAGNPRFHISMNNFGTSTFPPKSGRVHQGYSRYRIEKMAKYRNACLDMIEKERIDGDYLIVLDWDLKKIELRGLAECFSIDCRWDALFANGISRYPVIPVKRYFDAYALCECGKENIPQTMQGIFDSQKRLAFLKRGMPMFPVFSAFGGLAVYRTEAVRGCRYGVAENAGEGETVEAKSEHFYFHREMHARGHDKTFVNPALKVKYPHILYDVIKRYGAWFTVKFALKTIISKYR